MLPQFGATIEEWATFDLLLGLTQDLLPVVSNPAAEISLQSKMKEKGKTPSRYNGLRKVAGFPNWTAHSTTSREVAHWMLEPDYGVCLQTRTIRALDLDIPDPDDAMRIVDFISGYMHYMGFPTRSRNNSGKCLLAFRLPGDYAKRVIKTQYGIIEFLATGQQFIACGTHPSGVRYEWEWWGHNDFPVLGAHEFERLWSALIEEFAIETPAQANIRKQGQTVAVSDAVLGMLDIIGWGNQGQAFIECPFKEDHTVESGESEAAYFPRGTKGYEQGHFKCMHAHCAGRHDAEFEEALGIRDNEFEPIPENSIILNEQGDETVLPAERPKFRRTKSGVLAVVDNLLLAVARPDVCGLRIAYDTFRDGIMVAQEDSTCPWRPLADTDYTTMQETLERRIGFKPIALDLLRRAVIKTAMDQSFDSAIDWLVSLKWDGVPRINNFMSVYFGTDDDNYTRAVSRYLWTALAGRTMQPGIKADMVPILVGAQGIMKSSAVEALAPSHEQFVNISLGESDDNLSRKMRGRQVAEIGELRGLHTRELEAIKEFIAKTHERWIPKYLENSVTFPRRLVFIGTTNNEQFLADETGNRRWLPIKVVSIDIENLILDRNQLWAEGREMFQHSGLAYADAERLGRSIHDQYMIVDPWQSHIFRWLDTPDDLDGTTPVHRPYLLTEDILKEALNIETRNLRGAMEGKRVGAILRKLDYVRVKRRHAGRVVWAWCKNAPLTIVAGTDFC